MEKILKLLEEMIMAQQATLLEVGRCFVPRLTSEDALQPNDYPELEYNPHFRYEEGILTGMQSVRNALQALSKEQ